MAKDKKKKKDPAKKEAKAAKQVFEHPQTTGLSFTC